MAKQGFLERLRPGPRVLRVLMNLWSPFRGAGIVVTELAADYSKVRVELRTRWFNRNYVGTHFGGSLFAMTDPFCMVLMMHRLGAGYVVWDKSATIRYRKPGRGTVVADFQLPDAEVDRVRRIVDAEGRFEPQYEIEVKNAAGEVVAEVVKVLSIKRAGGLAAVLAHAAKAKSA